MQGRSIRDGMTSPMPWRRSLAFCAVSVGVGVGGHALASGHALHLAPVAILALLTLLTARISARTRLRPALVVNAVIATQLATHLVLSASSHVQGTVGAAAAHAGAHAHSMHAAAPAMSTPHEAVATMGLVPMLAFHLVATLLGIVALLRLEGRAWRGATKLVALVVVSVRTWIGAAVPAARSTVVGGTGRATSWTHADRPLAARWLAATGARRGPPVLLGNLIVTA